MSTKLTHLRNVISVTLGIALLRQGAELALKKDDGKALAKEFDRYGEIAVIGFDVTMWPLVGG
ncbi:MAG: hypothetical protein LBB22_06920 [Treponema sp.]|jgi:hypothetical protein|nr:hypothetical protein [Treponema sp.]